MEREPLTTDDRLARLEGQYHALSKELTDGFKSLRTTLKTIQEQVDDMHTVKSGLIRSETLADVVTRIDEQVLEMHKQVVAISNTVQTGK
jgi:septal ring factor EnvC (AmiA/AmiB activator)